MKSSRVFVVAALVGVLSQVHAVAAPTPSADSKTAVPVVAQDAWIRAVPGATMAAAYLTLRNTSAAAVTVLAISSPIAGSAMIHETQMHGGQSTMRPHPTIVIAPGKAVKLEPGGLHVMLHDLTQTLTPGQKVPLLIEWAPGTWLQVSATVRALTAE